MQITLSDAVTLPLASAVKGDSQERDVSGFILCVATLFTLHGNIIAMFIENSSSIAYRQLSTAAGTAFSVPEFVLLVDEADFSGWQLRYGEWTDFADRPGPDGAAQALQLAVEEMLERVEYRGK